MRRAATAACGHLAGKAADEGRSRSGALDVLVVSDADFGGISIATADVVCDVRAVVTFDVFVAINSDRAGAVARAAADVGIHHEARATRGAFDISVVLYRDGIVVLFTVAIERVYIDTFGGPVDVFVAGYRDGGVVVVARIAAILPERHRVDLNAVPAVTGDLAVVVHFDGHAVAIAVVSSGSACRREDVHTVSISAHDVAVSIHGGGARVVVALTRVSARLAIDFNTVVQRTRNAPVAVYSNIAHVAAGGVLIATRAAEDVYTVAAAAG